MDIILDTNIFRSDFFFKSKDFKILKDYLKKTDSRFVVPQIIIDELKGLYKRTLDENQNNFNKTRKALNNNLNREFINEIKIDTELETERYLELVFKNLGRKKGQTLKYRNDYLPEIISRAINRKKPFKDEDKGFRDTIIWLSILEYSQKCHEKQVIFISNNPKDFGDIKNPTELNESLKSECKSLKIKVNYFRTIKDFIEKHSKKFDFIDNEWLIENIDLDVQSTIIIEKLKTIDYNVVWRYEDKTENESTGEYKILKVIPCDQYDIFIYEMLNETLIINYTIKVETLIDFEYYDYQYFGDEEYRSTNNEVINLDWIFHMSAVCKNSKLIDLELSDIQLM